MAGFRQGSFPWRQTLGRWCQGQQCSLKSQFLLFGSAQCCHPWRTSGIVQCLWAVFSGWVFQSGRVQQLSYRWSCINLSLWLPVFAGILQNIPAATGFKSSLVTSRWLEMSTLLPWPGDAQKWICKCIHCLFSLFSPQRKNHCSPLQMLWGQLEDPKKAGREAWEAEKRPGR